MSHPLSWVVAVFVAAATIVIPSCASVSDTQGTGSTFVLDEAELGEFTPIARVLRHARCLNCHPMGDRPSVGDSRRLHAMNVQRGPDGHGPVGMHCSTCHQDQNQDYAKVPGAPHWHLAPLSMGWEGLDDHDLAIALLDRTKNGDRSVADLRKHLNEDPLVLWGWDPGVGRTPVPLPQQDFIRAFDAWAEAGTPIPQPGVTSYF